MSEQKRRPFIGKRAKLCKEAGRQLSGQDERFFPTAVGGGGRVTPGETESTASRGEGEERDNLSLLVKGGLSGYGGEGGKMGLE